MDFKDYRNNFLDYVTQERYSRILRIFSEINFLTYKKNKKISIVNCPITTQSISSPMGLASDSLPYKVISNQNKNFKFYLADSMQFYLELFLRANNVKAVGYISQTFRGEQVDERHLHQFNHFEIELVSSLNETKKTVIKYIKYIIKNLLKYSSQDLDYFNSSNTIRLKKWLKLRTINVSHEDAISTLKKEYREGIEIKQGFEIINSNGEKYLIKKYKNKIIWLESFPHELVPFYQKNKNGKAVNSDLLMGIGEIVGAGERSETYNETLKSLLDHGNNPTNYGWYLEMKKQIPLKSSGFGMGLERFLLFLINEVDIRNVQLIPRETDLEILP
ncbi:asparagine synthetase A [Mycoplasma sp. 'Moose RK']|uniref:asparagine synthetase A n=1 Tax=Mycoplasma sp. 'Moose RK' TaxID=2780095 RepID=UPI0018C2F471|nr:asparagine synthetase A [Mycoplasma sp. 'Moose RK']MBG0730901.1 asparagine ligase [Mycoplasma sp. 'Moose RK']